jgi:hypothetical protein
MLDKAGSVVKLLGKFRDRFYFHALVPKDEYVIALIKK